MPVATDIEAAFRSLPHDLLTSSSRVDFLHLLVAGKPALRVRAAEAALSHLRLWSVDYGYGYSSDDDGYCCVASDDALAQYVLEVDQRAAPHEVEMGLLLGYPLCCCKAIGRIGESRIDEQAELIAGWEFKRPFCLIDPSGYARGASLICHLPCSPQCSISLRVARRLAGFLRCRLGKADFATWAIWAGQL